MILKRPLFTVAAMFATVVAERSVTAPPAAADPMERTLLQIIRTPGAQPATVHPARNLASMTSVKYTAALQEVQRQGEVHSAARAADQTQGRQRLGRADPELLGPDLRHRTGRDVRTACSATSFNLAGRWVWCQATAAS